MGGHEVTRNLSGPSDQTLMNIDVYADFLRTMSPQTPSRALRALLSRGGDQSVRIDSRYTEAYGPHEVMLNIDGININTKTMITCDEDLASSLCRSRRTQGEINWALRHAGRRWHSLVNWSRRVCTCTGHKREEDPTTRTVGHRGRLECNTNLNMEKNG